MAVQNRQTLRNYFSSGQRPSGKQFEDLLDSVMHIHDDATKKDRGRAIEVYPTEHSRDVISILGKSGEEPLWTISLDENGDMAICGIKDENRPASLVLKANGDMEMHGNTIITTGSRKGICTVRPADGQWHTVATGLGGANVLEVVAVYTGKKGKNSTLIAWASHCSGKRRKIKRIRPDTFFWNNKIRMRWIKTKDENGRMTICNLQVKTRYSGGDGAIIKCSITTLWNRADMEQ